MALTALNNTINRLREEAETLRRQFNEQVAVLNNDKSISMHGKREIVAELTPQFGSKIDALQEQERDALEKERLSLTRQVFGSAGSGSDVISYRDAHDRAASLNTRGEITSAMQRALDANDAVLAQAILQKAINTSVTDAVDAYAAVHPASAEKIRDLADLHAFVNNAATDVQATFDYAHPAARLEEQPEGMYADGRKIY